MDALNKFFLLALLIACPLLFADQVDQTFERLRELSNSERTIEFSKLSVDKKIELFFVANGREPPYAGFDAAIEREGFSLLSKIRRVLPNKGGTPEVLGFLLIINNMKINGMLSHEEIDRLGIYDLCSLAPLSSYCKTLVEDIRP